MKQMALDEKRKKSKGSSAKKLKSQILRINSLNLKFVVCVNNGGYVDLEPLKVYKVRQDAAARECGLLRVVDNSGEDYLYPRDYFKAIQAPSELFRLIKQST